MVSNSRRKKKGSDIVDTSDKSSTSPSSLRDIFNYESPPIQKISHEDSFMARKVSSNTKKQKDVIKTSTSQDPSMIPKDQHLNTECQDIPRNLPIPYIQLPVGEVNKLDDLTVNTRKNIRRTYGKKNQDATRNEQLVLHSPDTAIHISPAQLSTKTVEKQPEAPHNKSQQQSTKIRKKSILSELSKGGSNVPSTSISGSKGGSNVPLVSISGSKDFSNSSSSSSKSRITDFPSSSQLTGMTSIKRKNPEESGSNELLTKHVKLNANIKSILEKVLEEQLKQRITIDNLQKSNEKLSHEIFENHKLLQNIFTILTSESTIMNEKTQRGGPKQRLKRKDTKHMWWDTPMTKACHQLFQVNKNPSDADVEQAFRSQVQADFPQKMQELVNSNEWTNLWKAVHSIMLEYFRNHRSFYVRKIKDAIYSLLNLFSYKLNQFAGPKEVMQWKRSERVKKARCNIWKKIDDNDPNSPCTIEAILQRAFTKEELQNKNNIKFGVTVALMFLDPTYDQVEILSSKVQERMDQWDSNPIIQRWLEGKELLEDDMTDYVDDNELSMHFDKDVTMDDDNEPSIHFDQESDSDNDVENGVYNNEDAEKTDSEDSD